MFIFFRFDVQNENFFPTNVRVMIVDFILERQCAGIQRLVANGVYTAAYPLHDVNKILFIFLLPKKFI